MCCHTFWKWCGHVLLKWCGHILLKWCGHILLKWCGPTGNNAILWNWLPKKGQVWPIQAPWSCFFAVTRLIQIQGRQDRTVTKDQTKLQEEDKRKKGRKTGWTLEFWSTTASASSPSCRFRYHISFRVWSINGDLLNLNLPELYCCFKQSPFVIMLMLRENKVYL